MTDPTAPGTVNILTKHKYLFHTKYQGCAKHMGNINQTQAKEQTKSHTNNNPTKHAVQTPLCLQSRLLSLMKKRNQQNTKKYYQ